MSIEGARPPLLAPALRQCNKFDRTYKTATGWLRSLRRISFLKFVSKPVTSNNATRKDFVSNPLAKRK